MSLSNITAGERRGLIALIVVLCLVTAALCWRDFAVTRAAIEPCGAAVPPDSVIDSVRAAQSGVAPFGGIERKAEKRMRQRAKSADKTRKSQSPMRSPRDERVD